MKTRYIMLSPKMQRTIRVNENQLVMLSERAHYDHSQAGYLHKRTADSTKWQLRWFILYQVSALIINNFHMYLHFTPSSFFFTMVTDILMENSSKQIHAIIIYTKVSNYMKYSDCSRELTCSLCS